MLAISAGQIIFILICATAIVAFWRVVALLLICAMTAVLLLGFFEALRILGH